MPSTIWMLHRVLPAAQIKEPNAYWERGTLITTEYLHTILAKALAQGLQFYTLSKWYQRYRQGIQTAQDRVLTFDDGYADNYWYALPILQQYGIPATFFPILRYCLNAKALCPLDYYYALLDQLELEPAQRQDWIRGATKRTLLRLHPYGQARWVRALHRQYLPQWQVQTPQYMTPQQLQYLLSEGHEIGGHSWTHPILPQLSPTQLHRELTRTQKGLDRLGVPTGQRTFAYPDGAYNSKVIEALQKQGYTCAVTVQQDQIETPYTWSRQFIRMPTTARL